MKYWISLLILSTSLQATAPRLDEQVGDFYMIPVGSRTRGKIFDRKYIDFGFVGKGIGAGLGFVMWDILYEGWANPYYLAFGYELENTFGEGAEELYYRAAFRAAKRVIKWKGLIDDEGSTVDSAIYIEKNDLAVRHLLRMLEESSPVCTRTRIVARAYYREELVKEFGHEGASLIGEIMREVFNRPYFKVIRANNSRLDDEEEGV